MAGINAASPDALRAQLPARHELKFYINPGDYLILRGLLDKVLRRDVHGDGPVLREATWPPRIKRGAKAPASSKLS